MARRTRSAFSRKGLPKLENDSSATRGSWPNWRALRAAWMAMSASSSGVGSSCTVVSAMNTVRVRDRKIERPNSRSPGLASSTRVTSSKVVPKLRVTPLTMASASPCATMQAANTLRSWFTMRWQSR